MEKKVIVFDFDKTLINYDSTFLFLKFCFKKKPYRYLLLPFYFFAKVLSKLRIISVKKEKELGLYLFCPRNIEDFKEICYQFSSNLLLNNLYYKEFLPLKKTNSKLVIASASFTYYLEKLFPEANIIGTTVSVNSARKIIGIKDHPFREEKACLLFYNGIKKIHEFYTDSKNDMPTSLLAINTFWVKNGKIIKRI